MPAAKSPKTLPETNLAIFSLSALQGNGIFDHKSSCNFAWIPLE
jgi:hypothetical protein